jgi:anti-sigma-K factor RskA
VQPDAELIDRLAAEYVLGTLRGPARRRFERWLRADANVRATVRAWEDRLTGLNRAPPVAPSADAWRGIETRLGFAPRRSAATRWAPLALAASLLLAVGGGWLVWREVRWQPAAELAAAPGATAWRVEIVRDGSELRVAAERPLPLPANAAHELWALPDDGGAPVSLGLLPQAGTRVVVLTATQRAAWSRATKLAVSREPAGGSPTGQPTGPVLLVVPRIVRA